MPNAFQGCRLRWKFVIDGGAGTLGSENLSVLECLRTIIEFNFLQGENGRIELASLILKDL